MSRVLHKGITSFSPQVRFFANASVFNLHFAAWGYQALSNSMDAGRRGTKGRHRSTLHLSDSMQKIRDF